MEPFTQIEMAMREWARRFLKHDRISIKSPERLSNQIITLHIFYNDKAPSQYSEINQIIHVEDNISLYYNDVLIGQIGGQQPYTISSVYIPSNDIDDTWNIIDRIIRELIIAGYPGCIGCGGPGAEEEWDEKSHREFIINS